MGLGPGRVERGENRSLGKPVPIDASVAEALLTWRLSSPYRSDTDFVFASARMRGKQPLTTGILFRRHVIPYLEQAGIGQRIGWHTCRRTVATLLTANGEDIKNRAGTVAARESPDHNADLLANGDGDQASGKRKSRNDDCSRRES